MVMKGVEEISPGLNVRDIVQHGELLCLREALLSNSWKCLRRTDVYMIHMGNWAQTGERGRVEGPKTGRGCNTTGHSIAKAFRGKHLGLYFWLSEVLLVEIMILFVNGS